jgi:hypothetical protein
VVRKERNERAGGAVAIFINKILKYSRTDVLYNGDGKIEVCAIQPYTGQDVILIVPCYKRHILKSSWRYGKIIRIIQR